MSNIDKEFILQVLLRLQLEAINKYHNTLKVTHNESYAGQKGEKKMLNFVEQEMDY